MYNVTPINPTAVPQVEDSSVDQDTGPNEKRKNKSKFDLR